MTFGVAAAVAAPSSSIDNITPGLLGFLVFAAMGIALVLLLRSMNKQFRKIAPPPSPPSSSVDPPAPQATSDGQDANTPAQTPK